MRPTVRFRLPDGSVRTLGPGDVVGRLHTAALALDDASISEAHALVSLRGGELRLLGLRGLFAVDGEPRSEITLEPGMHLQLSREVGISVEAVALPTHLLAVEGEGVPRRVLSGVVSLSGGTPPTIVARYVDSADAWLWEGGDGWRLRRRGAGAPAPARAGDTLELGPGTLRLLEVPLAAAGQEPTRMGGGIAAPLTVRARFDSVHLLREGEPPVVLTGQLARLLSELVVIGAPVAWEELARTLFADAADTWDRRRRWDLALVRLRRKLREAGIRPDLVRADGNGNFELVLGPHDHAEDQT
jgi:hypothetical protein